MEFLVEYELNVPEGTPESDTLQTDLNRGVFIGVAAREAAGMIYETYLVQ